MRIICQLPNQNAAHIVQYELSPCGIGSILITKDLGSAEAAAQVAEVFYGQLDAIEAVKGMIGDVKVHGSQLQAVLVMSYEAAENKVYMGTGEADKEAEYLKSLTRE